jgi:hypothetical protein
MNVKTIKPPGYPAKLILALHLMLGYAVKLLTQPTHCTLRQAQGERLMEAN